MIMVIPIPFPKEQQFSTVDKRPFEEKADIANKLVLGCKGLIL